MAPPPATIVENFMALRTTIMASFKDLSASWMNCSAPPLRMIVADLLYKMIKIKNIKNAKIKQ
jgi:hypothetical protein